MLGAEGRIGVLINSAGGGVGQVGRPVEEVGDDDWDRVVRTNLYSAFYCIRAVAPAMNERRNEGQQRLVEGIASRRLGRAEDIANGVLFFVSDLAGWISGQTLSIDGGRHMV